MLVGIFRTILLHMIFLLKEETSGFLILFLLYFVTNLFCKINASKHWDIVNLADIKCTIKEKKEEQKLSYN